VRAGRIVVSLGGEQVDAEQTVTVLVVLAAFVARVLVAAALAGAGVLVVAAVAFAAVVATSTKGVTGAATAGPTASPARPRSSPPPSEPPSPESLPDDPPPVDSSIPAEPRFRFSVTARADGARRNGRRSLPAHVINVAQLGKQGDQPPAAASCGHRTTPHRRSDMTP
jgi:hypothetical protein